METNRLRQFCVICETGNLRKAAELLSISHSGLSKSMKAFEGELGFALFNASGRGIVISDNGLILYNRSQSFLAELDRLLGVKAEKEDQVLRLGSFEVFTTYFMGPLLQNFIPGREVEIHELVPGKLEESLALNKIDIGITYEPVPRKGIEYVKVASLLMGAYALKGKFKNLELEDVPFIVPVTPLEGAPSGVKGRDAWPDEKIKRNIRFRVDLLATGLEIARQGLGAVFIPRFVAKLHNHSAALNFKLEALTLPRTVGSVKRDIYLVKRESSGEDKTIRDVARALREICQED
ncbi:MAG: LysR family transcriptional regulator [Bacteriovoracaceae bacterium]